MFKFYGGAAAKFGILGCACVLMLCMAGCSSSEDRYLDTLESAQDKFYSGNGGDMTSEESDALEGFLDWKSSQD
ncbi:MAG: hypothetical protein ACLROE_04365 [Collinsella intestinalis]|uniref:Uncharacterized protein n=1 Tax=Collinsella intestinalis TaxID=147207 RepID=A0A6N3CMP2_9ACTN